jgi:hypothetical protein
MAVTSAFRQHTRVRGSRLSSSLTDAVSAMAVILPKVPGYVRRASAARPAKTSAYAAASRNGE